MNEQLTSFVERALAKGESRDAVEQVLLEAGWPRDEVKDALGMYADVAFSIPVPKPRPYASARDAFVFLVVFMTLYVSAIAWGQLLFQFIQLWLPDPKDSQWLVSRIESNVRWATASLLVAAPAYFWLSRWTYRVTRENPEKRQSKVRKWLTYLTLFVAAAVLLTDFIVLIFHLLDGELTLRFLLKTAVVGGIAGSVFGFYLWSLRQDDVDPAELPERNPGVRAFSGTLAGVVLLSVIAGLFVAGSPQRAREQNYDRQRVAHLDSLRQAIQAYYHRREELPRTLEELADEPGLADSPMRDPVSDVLYGYRALGADTYEICAVFDREDPRGRQQWSEDLFWAHGAGKACFDVTVHED